MDNNTQNIDLSRNDGNTMLSYGFRSKREQNRFAKLLTYAITYSQAGDWDEEVITATRDYCESEAKRLGFPDGWKNIGTYDELKQWFLKLASNGKV